MHDDKVKRYIMHASIARGIPTRGAYFGEGSGPIHLSNAQCTNTDTRLLNCVIDKTGVNGCTHSKDAGVICLGNSNDNEVFII